MVSIWSGISKLTESEEEEFSIVLTNLDDFLLIQVDCINKRLARSKQKINTQEKGVKSKEKSIARVP